jgi:hypothetical protein
MLHLKASLLADALRQTPQQRHRIIDQLPAPKAKQMRMLAASVNMLVNESPFVDGNTLKHSPIHQQIERTVNRGTRSPLAAVMQAEKQIVR